MTAEVGIVVTVVLVGVGVLGGTGPGEDRAALVDHVEICLVFTLALTFSALSTICFIFSNLLSSFTRVKGIFRFLVLRMISFWKLSDRFGPGIVFFTLTPDFGDSEAKEDFSKTFF